MRGITAASPAGGAGAHRVGSSPPAIRLPKLTGRMLGKAAVGFAVSLGAWYLLRGAYNDLLGGFGRVLFPWFGGPAGVEPLIVERGGVFWLNTGLRAGDGRGMHLVQLEPAKLHWNGIVFLTLVWLLPLWILAARWRRVIVAIGVMGGLHVVNYVLALAIVCGQAYQAHGLPFGADLTMTLVAGAYLASTSVLAPALPFLLVAFIAAGASRPGSPPAARRRRGATAGRNDPCPCGSGRKFKHCCGGAP